MNIKHKWGFGHAPLKKETEYKNRKAIILLYKNLKDEDATIDLDAISLVKGLLNRCLRKDQWDWFTVYTLFGRPELNQLKKIVPLLTSYRTAIKNDELLKAEEIKKKLIEQDILDLFKVYLRKKEVKLTGYIYILSRREEPNILKIGMTTRDVGVRLKEINSATGVLVPYSIREIFKVNDPKKAERLIFDKLVSYRIRSDREFFYLEFKEARGIIQNCLIENNLEK